MRLLIVEDDAPLASGLSRILEAEGHAVDVTERGEDAVLAASQEHLDPVTLDIGLPRMDGFEVLRRLRAAEKPIPVLVLTARDAVDDRVRGLDLGADDYMVKPFAMPELTARVRALLRRSQSHGGPRIMHGPLTLDTVARRAFLRNEPLELAAREWAGSEGLLAKVEKIASKEAIIQAGAGWGDDLSPNAIEVYVSRLRSKLEPAGIRIRTVRGFGYMLEEYKGAANCSEPRLAMPARSLRAHLLRMLLPPVGALLVLGALVAYYPSIEPATTAYDQGLIDAGISLGTYIRAGEAGHYLLELPSAVDQVLRRDSYD